MTKKRNYKKWSSQEIAWLSVNLDKSNVWLSEITGRGIHSLESMKRDIRKGKKKVDPVMQATLQNEISFTLGTWMEHYETIVDDYKMVAYSERNTPCCISVDDVPKDGISTNPVTPELSQPITPDPLKIVHPPVDVQHDEGSDDPSCLGDRAKELGLNSDNDITSHVKVLIIVLGVLVFIAIMLMLIL